MLLFVGRMIEKKRPATVLRAFAESGLEYNWHLVMVGDGPLLGDMKSLARSLGVNSSVTYTGFVDAEKVHCLMAASDIFALPSAETWGVAPIEALSLGCNLLLSREVGCSIDLLKRYPDVHIVDSGDDVRMLAQKLEAIAPSATRRQSDDNRTFLRGFHYAQLGTGLQEFLEDSVV